MQNSEEIILSHIQQFDASFTQTSFKADLDQNKTAGGKIEGDAAATNYLANFLLRTLCMAVNEVCQRYLEVTVYDTQVYSLVQVLQVLLPLLTYIGKSGNFSSFVTKISIYHFYYHHFY